MCVYSWWNCTSGTFLYLSRKAQFVPWASNVLKQCEVVPCIVHSHVFLIVIFLEYRVQCLFWHVWGLVSCCSSLITKALEHSLCCEVGGIVRFQWYDPGMVQGAFRVVDPLCRMRGQINHHCFALFVQGFAFDSANRYMTYSRLKKTDLPSVRGAEGWLLYGSSNFQVYVLSETFVPFQKLWEDRARVLQNVFCYLEICLSSSFPFIVAVCWCFLVCTSVPKSNCRRSWPASSLLGVVD